MKKYNKILILLAILVISLSFATSVDALTFNQTNVSVPVGQSLTVYASSYSNSLYVSSNLNYTVANVTVSGNMVNIYGLAIGNTTVTICESAGYVNCSSIYVTVNTNGNGNGNGNGNYYNNNLNLNISNLSLVAGSSATISSSNSTGLYVSTNSSPSIASTSTSSLIPGCINNNQYSIVTGQPCYQTTYNNNNGSILISALTAGTDTITLCQTGGIVCSSIYITVTGYTTPIDSSYYSTPIGNNYDNSGIPIIYSTSKAY